MSTAQAWDPQNLSFAGKARTLWALGRVRYASEVPVWTLLGCVLSSQIHHASSSSSSQLLAHFDWLAALQCMFATWATNISINYFNDFFDWDVDRPGQIDAITNDIKRREAALKAAKGDAEAIKDVEVEFEMVKSGGHTTRCIHDGTFTPYAALYCGLAWQMSVALLILASRSAASNGILSFLRMPSLRPGMASTPFAGFPLHLTLVGTFFAQEYIAPPLKLHYRGWGELLSAVFMVPFNIVFGLTGHYVASTGNPITWRDLFANENWSYAFDRQVWTLLLGLYLFEQARILVMHINDIDGDREGGKFTFVTRIGHTAATQLYGIVNILCITTFCYLVTLLSEPGQLSRAISILPGKANVLMRQQTAWASGLAAVACYYLPVALVTYSSLLAADPAKTAKYREPSSSVVPRLTVPQCAIMVSLQLLVAPWFFSGTVLAASRAASVAR